MNILCFAGSNSSKSINYSLVSYIASKIDNINVKTIDLRDFEIPIYGIDYQTEFGIPDDVKELYLKIKTNDKIIISVAEHNRNLTSFFKNILDWISRIEKDFLSGKKVFILSTSPGYKGASTALELASKSVRIFGGEVTESYSLVSFDKNVSINPEFKITNPEINDEINKKLNTFINTK